VKRSLLLVAAWIASAAAAVGLGFLAVSLVGASASPGTLTAAAATSATATAEPTATPTGRQSTAQKATEAGIVYAECADGVPGVAGAPATGWWLDDRDDGDDPGEVEFESNGRKLEVKVRCVDGSPQFSVEGPRPEDNADEGPHSSSTPSTTATAPPSTDGPDDSDGRVDGGHGSDDGPGDDRDGDSDDHDDLDDSGKGRGSDD
jgi:hypothetical protein